MLGSDGWDELRHRTDMIFCSLPYIVPHIIGGLDRSDEKINEDYQELLCKSFYEITGLLRRPGRLLTVDYNTVQIQNAIRSLDMDIDPLIDQGNSVFYMASVLNS